MGDAEPVIAEAIAGRRERFSWFRKFCRATIAARHHHGCDAFAGAVEDRPARLLSAALARDPIRWMRRLARSIDCRCRENRSLGVRQFWIPTISDELLAVCRRTAR